MASGDQKAIVKKNTLPPVTLLSDGTYGYIIRHRIISEDQNRYSQYSPIREITGQPVTAVTGDLIVSSNSSTVIWDDALERPSYDIFVRFDSTDDDDYFYHGTSPIHTYSFVNRDSNGVVATSTVDVSIQIESIEKEKADALVICDVSGIIGS